jgi:hypothetical protein
MSTITRSVILLTAAVAAVVVAFATSGPHGENSTTPSAQVAQRFPLTSEIFTPVPITYFVSQKLIAAHKTIAAQKSHGGPNTAFCASTPNGWPYVSLECRVAAAATHVPTLMRS